MHYTLKRIPLNLLSYKPVVSYISHICCSYYAQGPVNMQYTNLCRYTKSSSASAQNYNWNVWCFTMKKASTTVLCLWWHTDWVAMFGGGGFRENSASEICWKGRSSSGWMTKSGLSQRLLGLGCSNLITRASNLNKTNISGDLNTLKKEIWNWM